MKSVSLAVLSSLAVAASISPSVTIDAGTLQGGQCKNTKDAVYYKAIPFAEPPIGELRFEPPQAYKNKYPGGTLNAKNAPPSCLQFGTEFAASGELSEDCLYLDVWAPSNATKDSKLPVKVWIYGGSNVEGGISMGLFDGCNSAEDGSIIVSINYRVGPPGFMALSNSGIYGNQGIQDLVLGLEWVQANIAAFGGDAKKVLLFGQSAGAEDAFILASLDKAPSLMNSVIMESGAGKRLTLNSTIHSVSASYAETLKCSINDKACLQSKTADELIQAYSADDFLNEGIGAIDSIGIGTPAAHNFYPYVDGKIIPEEPLSRGIQVPGVFGYNKNEGIISVTALIHNSSDLKQFTPSFFKSFLQKDFGDAASLIEKYYPLDAYKAAAGSSELGVMAAIADVITDSDYRCIAYEGLVSASSKNIPVWTYEYIHNNTCAWLDTIAPFQNQPEILSLLGATHTAEIPFVFGNMANQPLPNGTCNATEAEYHLSKQMMSLWTAMAENAKPSTDTIQWPRFSEGQNVSTPGLIFANSTLAGQVDYQICKILWNRIYDLLEENKVGGSNSTTSATGMVTASPSATPMINGAKGAVPSMRKTLALGAILIAAYV